MLFAHITIKQFHPSLLRRMQNEWQLFRQHVTAPIFAVGEVDDDKWERFISRFDFKYQQHVICENGQRRRLFVSFAINKQEEKHERAVLPGPDHERCYQQ
jgi:hypothetical protein